MTHATPSDPIEVRWQYLTRELGALGYSREQIDNIPTEEEAWDIIRTTPPSRSNGHGAEQATGGSDDGYTMQIIAEMMAASIELPPTAIITDGKIHRFVSKSGTQKKNGWYVVHPDPVMPTWTFGDWSVPDLKKQHGKGKPGRELSPEEQAAFEQRQREQGEKVKAERDRAWKDAAIEADQRWKKAKPATKNHPYLKKQQIDACGARIENGNLLIPMHDIDGKLWSLQEINEDWKSNQPGGRRKGCFTQIGNIGKAEVCGETRDILIVCEGFATGASLHMATGYAVFAAGDAHNLEKVAPILRQKYKDAAIIIAGDDDWLARYDHGEKANTGEKAAEKAAKAVDGILVLPWFNPKGARPPKATDFNDEHKQYGLGEVRTTVKYALDKYEDTRKHEREADTGDEKIDDSDTDDSISGDADTEALKATRQEIKEKLNAAIDNLNKKYCVVSDSGSVFIFSDRYERELGRRIYDRMTKTGFMMLLESKPPICTSISGEGKRSAKPIAKVWLTSRHRRTYDEVVFDPTTKESRDGKLNLWRGFEFNPKPGTWNRLKEHICNNICSTDTECINYLMSWMARAVQLPAQQGEVAVVLRGGKGVGKGILGHILRKLFGQHGMYISQSKHLVGAFNAHLRDCVFLFADEAFFAGDKSSEGVLKSLITEDVITIEPKGQNAILCKNRLHTLMASNEKWVVPASLDERRFLILDVSNAHFGDYPYFDKIKTEMEAGGYEAMLHDLLNYDISDFNVRRVPGTAALDDQKKLSLLHELQWWHDVLARRYVYRSKHGLEAYFGRWHDLVSTEILFDSYQDFAKSRNVRHPMTRVSFGRFMTTMGCKPSRPSKDGVTGEHQVRSEVTGLLRAEPITKDRPPGYLLGTLEVARQAFEAHTKLPFDWDAEEETAEAAIAEPHEPQEQP